MPNRLSKTTGSSEIDQLHSYLRQADSSRAVLSGLLAFLARRFNADYISVTFNLPNEGVVSDSFGESNKSDNPSTIFTLHEQELSIDGTEYINAVYVSDAQAERIEPKLTQALNSRDTKSFALSPIFQNGAISGWIEVHFRKSYYRFQKQDIFYLDIAGEYSALYLHKLEKLSYIAPATVQVNDEENLDDKSATDELYRRRLLEAREQYGRLLEFGNLLIVQTDQKGVVTSVVGDTEKIFGVSAGELIADIGVWERFVPAKDFRLLLSLVRNGIEQKQQLKEEIRIVNQKTREVKRLLIHGRPLFASSDEFLGWEGYAVDITEKHRVQEDAEAQRKRLAALYDISQSLSVSMDPSVLLLKGLRSMMRATNADCGLAVSFDSAQDRLEVVATEGLSSGDLIDINREIPREALFRSVIAGRKAMMVSGDTVVGAGVARTMINEMKGAVFAPLVSDDQVKGIIALYARKASRFSAQDLDVAEVASKQVATILRQAEFYQTERRTSDVLAFLYRLSHVVSQCLTPQEIAESAFPIIQEETPCKRMWLGVLNDQGTVIAGQSAIGPGMRSSIAKVQIELELRHDYLDKAIKSKQPVVVTDLESAECSGLNRIVKRLQIDVMIVVPLTALGQVVGVLVVEPLVSSPVFAEKNLSLFASIGAELGSLILARRFESRIADAEKMRMASLFAAGVAHNFNNMLQAIMGQASLIEIQVGSDSPIAKSARVINEAVSRGASLVQQLKGFSNHSIVDRKNFSIQRLLTDARLLYESIIGPDIKLAIDIGDDVREVYADEGQIQRAIANILVNAKEALQGRPNPSVIIRSTIEKLRTGEVHPELAPGTYVAVSIQDNGLGISAEKLPRIFEPFYTTKGVDAATGVGLSGSGLGLSSTYAIMKQHEGIVIARSEENRGATFTLYIPVSKVKSEVTQLDVKQTVNSNQPWVGFLGLDPLTANSLSGSLRELSVDANPFDSISDLSTVVKFKSELPSLVVIDAEQTDSMLTAHIQNLREVNPKIKVIIFCVDANKWTSMLSLIGPMVDLEIVEKSMGAWSLQAAIKRMLGLKRPMPKIEAARPEQ